MRNYLMIALLALLPCAALAADEAGVQHTIQQGDVSREYYLYTPSKASAEPRPLVVVMHGGAGNPNNAAKMSGFSKLAERENILVAYPAGTGRIPTWNAGKCCGYAERNQVDDVGFIRAMVQEIQKSTPVDPARIYATGMSNGGMMAYRLACEMADVFTAVAPVAGAMNTTSCTPSARPNIAIFHALDDQSVLYEGGPSKSGIRAMFGKEPAPDQSVAETMRFWLAHNSCRKYPLVDESVAGVGMQNYYCAGKTEIRLFTLSSGGHSWPGGEKGRAQADEPVAHFSATEKMWEFFMAHPPQEIF